MNITSDALLTDLYELTMAQAYLAQGMTDIAVFEFFVRKLPPQRNFFMAAGLEQVLNYLEEFQFSVADIAWLDQTGGFSASCPTAIRCCWSTGYSRFQKMGRRRSGLRT